MAITVTPWTAANNKFTQNLSGSTSIAAGYMGSDAASSIDLGGNRVLWHLGDTFWATAAGQTRSQCLFIRNSIAIQSGSYDLSASTLTFYAGTFPDGTGTTPGSFYPETGPYNWYWPMSGVLIDDKLLVMLQKIRPDPNVLGFDVDGWSAYIVDNPSAAPTSWIMNPVPTPYTNKNPGITLQLLDPGDGFIYGYGRGEDGGMYTLRWNRLEAKGGRLMAPQWWCGTPYGWSDFNPHSRTLIKPAAVMTGDTANDGSLYRKSGGTYVTIQAPGFGAAHFNYATSSSLSGPFSGFTDFYTPPESTQMNGPNAVYLVYAGKGHREQTWSGKAVDDLACTYAASPTASGGLSVYTDMTSYWPRVVQVTGI